jgi:predicted metal-dependent hydrolase
MSEIRSLNTPLGPATLKRTTRKTLAISVLPDGALELIAPRSASEQDILAKIAKRSKWISAQRWAFQQMNAVPAPKRYVAGATHRYLGRQYRLKLLTGNPPEAKLKGAYFLVTTPLRSPKEVETALGNWFRARAREQFAKRIEAWAPWCRKHHLPNPRLQIRFMKKRWGSAGAGGRIALNPELIHMPAPCIDYVVIHEICHLRHPAHDKSFFRLLTTLLPNWRALKKRLECAEAS